MSATLNFSPSPNGSYTQGKASITIPAGHLLTPHWHPNANEVTTCSAGQGSVTLIYPDPAAPGDPGKAQIKTYPLTEGSTVFLPQGYLHYFVNESATENFVIDLTFDNANFDILALAFAMELFPANIKSAIDSAIKKGIGGTPVIPY
jgi:oxalate decarboxylase/phosphoglucose isomerase-like protein (cupin superfamily)